MPGKGVSAFRRHGCRMNVRVTEYIVGIKGPYHPVGGVSAPLNGLFRKMIDLYV